MERVFSAERLNEIINDPSVYPWVCGVNTERLDCSTIVQNTNNVALLGEHGGFIAIQHQPGLYEVHSQVLPAGRGPWAMSAARESAKWMFTHTNAVELTTRVPAGNIAALALTKRNGFEFEFTNPHGWVIDGSHVSADIYSLTIGRWIRTAHDLEQRGHWFHKRLDEEFKRLGRLSYPHPEISHDRQVGASVEMVLGGQPDKGVIFYNRWASMADFDLVSIVTRSPLTIDIGEAILFIRNDNFWVI